MLVLGGRDNPLPEVGGDFTPFTTAVIIAATAVVAAANNNNDGGDGGDEFSFAKPNLGKTGSGFQLHSETAESRLSKLRLCH